MGLLQGGFSPVLGIEKDSACLRVTQAVKQLAHIIQGDVKDLTHYRKGMAEVLWSSFPCQAWSVAGKRQGATDERNLWPATVDAIDAVKPQWVLCENVRGLTFHRSKAECGRGEAPKPAECPRCYLDHVIMAQLRQRYAWADWTILDSADFGTAQHRRRIFIGAGPVPVG